MAEEEELKHDILPLNTLIAWERIQLPSLPTQFQSQSSVIVLSDPITGNGRWSTLPDNKNHRTSVVFPPNNHEGLNLHHDCDVRETFEDRAKPPLPVSTELTAVSAEMGGPVAVKWWFSHFRLPVILSCVWKSSVIRGGLLLLRSFNFPLIGSMVLLLLFCLRFRLRRRRRRLRGEAIDELLGVIKEKDEKIHCLLHQIARMNELLLASHHGVPMISKATST